MTLLEKARRGFESLGQAGYKPRVNQDIHDRKHVIQSFDYSFRLENLLYLISQREDTDERLKKTIEKLLEQGK